MATKKEDQRTVSGPRKALEVGTREAIEVFKGKKTPVEAASTVLNSLKRFQDKQDKNRSGRK